MNLHPKSIVCLKLCERHVGVSIGKGICIRYAVSTLSIYYLRCPDTFYLTSYLSLLRRLSFSHSFRLSHIVSALLFFFIHFVHLANPLCISLFFTITLIDRLLVVNCAIINVLTRKIEIDLCAILGRRCVFYFLIFFSSVSPHRRCMGKMHTINHTNM